MKQKSSFSLLTLVVTTSLYAQQPTLKLSLQEAIDIALKQSHQQKISQYDLEIAREQYRQAMSANYPSLDLVISAVKRDEELVNVTKGTLELPEDMSNALALITAADNQKPMVQQMIDANMLPPVKLPLNFTSVVLGDRVTSGKIELTYPLYSGGKISAIQKQAKLGKEIARIHQKRTTQEVVFDIRKYYSGVLLTSAITDLLADTSARMDALNDLTETMYKGESTKVKKTDYYRTKIAATAIKAFYTQMQQKRDLAKSALLFAMGMDPHYEIVLTTQSKIVGIKTQSQKLQSLIAQAYRDNAQLAAIDKALGIYEAKIDEAKSGYKPSVALIGRFEKLDSNYNGGMSNPQNNNSWSVGVGAQWNLFNGFRTTGEVHEAKLAKLKLLEQKKQLKRAIALQVKEAYNSLLSTHRQLQLLQTSVQTAEANRDLNIRAYRADMAETKDVVEAQITEAQIKAKYFQTLYAYRLSAASLDLVTGKTR